MKRIFLEDVTSSEIKISGQDARHLAYALRAKRGDRITAVDGSGNCAVIELIDFDRETIKAQRVGEVMKVVGGGKIICQESCSKNFFMSQTPLKKIISDIFH